MSLAAFAASAQTKPTRVFRLGVSSDIATVDPARVASAPELAIASQLFETLLRLDPATGQGKPGAAEKWQVSEDGKKITFTLRKDLFWSSGERVTAEDYAYSLRRLLDPADRTFSAPWFFSIVGAEDLAGGLPIAPGDVGIAAADDRTLVISLVQPDSFLLEAFAEPVTATVPRKQIERLKENWWKAGSEVGSGPFILSKWTDEDVVLVKNPHHRNAAKIALDEVHFRRFKSRAEGVAAFQKGEVDQFGQRDFGVPAELLGRWAGRKELQFQPDLRVTLLRLSGTRPPLSQQKFRQALAMATDRSPIVSGVVRNGATSAFSLIPEGVRGYDPPQGYLQSGPGARQALRDSGYCVRGVTSSCKPMPVLELSFLDRPEFQKVALALEVQWRQALGLEYVRHAPKTREDLAKLRDSGEFMLMIDELAIEPERPYAFLDAFRRKQSSAGGFYSSEFDKLLDQSRHSADAKASKQLLRQAEALLLSDATLIPLYHGATPILVSTRVSGFVPNLWDRHPLLAVSVSWR